MLSGASSLKKKTKKDGKEKPSYNKRLLYAAIVGALSIMIVASTFVYLQPSQPTQPKAAIIDQLSSSQLSLISRHENAIFIETAEEMLYKRFPEIVYYSDNATVDEYKRLPSLGYKLILWRAHSAVDPDNYVAISTSEKHVPNKYTQYSADQLKLCNITGDSESYFAITPAFIKECMSGRFEDTVIILMSCNGLNQTHHRTAEALIDKGAKVIISWNGWILPSDNDNAITLLLRYLIEDDNTIDGAVNKILVQWSPWGSSRLSYYPDVGNYRIPNYKQNDTTTNAHMVVISIPERLKPEHIFQF